MSEHRTARVSGLPAGTDALVFRPRVRFVAIEAAAATVLTVAAALLQLSYVPWAAGGYALVLVLQCIRLRLSWTRVDNHGIALRAGLRKLTMPWTDVVGMFVQNRLRYRRIRVNVFPNRTVTLPAPRSDLFTNAKAFEADVASFARFANTQRGGAAMQRMRQMPPLPRVAYPVLVILALAYFVTLDRPWFWASGPEAARLPDPCAGVIGGPAAALGVTGASERAASTRAGLPTRTCVATGPDGHSATVVYLFGERHGLMSGAGVANSVFSHESWVPRERISEQSKTLELGDEAWAADGNGWSVVTVRRANVIITVELTATPGVPTLNDAIGIAAVAVADIEALTV